MPTPGFYGYQAPILLGSTTTPTNPLDYQAQSLARHKSVIDLNGLKGTRTRFVNRAVEGLQPVAGQLTCYPTPVELAFLLPWILGGTPVGTNYPLAEVISTFYYWHLRGALIFKYPGVGVASATISGSQGGGLNLTLNLIGTTEDHSTTATTEFANYLPDITTTPFAFHQLALTVNSVTYLCRNFQIVIDNGVDPSRFFNNQALQTVQATDRVITVSHDLPYGPSAAAYDVNQDTGVAMNAVFTAGGTSFTIALPHVQYEPTAPVVMGRGEVMLPLSGVARSTTALGEAVFTLDDTP